MTISKLKKEHILPPWCTSPYTLQRIKYEINFFIEKGIGYFFGILIAFCFFYYMPTVGELKCEFDDKTMKLLGLNHW